MISHLSSAVNGAGDRPSGRAPWPPGTIPLTRHLTAENPDRSAHAELLPKHEESGKRPQGDSNPCRRLEKPVSYPGEACSHKDLRPSPDSCTSLSTSGVEIAVFGGVGDWTTV